MRAVLIGNTEAQSLALDVDGALRNGYDLQGGLVKVGNRICQWVVEAQALYDYHLVVAASPEILEALVNGHIENGWDFYRDTIPHDGDLLQWMMRENQAHDLFGAQLRQALTSELQTTMVVDARKVLHLVPTASSAWSVPYPVTGS